MASRIEPIKQLYRMAKRPRKKLGNHLEFIRKLPCAVCSDATSTEAAHVRMSSYRWAKPETGVGRKPDDTWTVPLCGGHHRLQHNIGEFAFWEQYKIDPHLLALGLWWATGDEETATRILERAK